MVDFDDSAELMELMTSLPFDGKVIGTSSLDMMKEFFCKGSGTQNWIELLVQL